MDNRYVNDAGIARLKREGGTSEAAAWEIERLAQSEETLKAKVAELEAENTRMRVELIAIRQCDCPLPWHYVGCKSRTG